MAIISPFLQDSPTNPLFGNSSTFTTRLFTAIMPDSSEVLNIQYFGGGENAEFSNLANTKGFRIKCFDSTLNQGILFNPNDFDTGQDATTFDYFVLVHSNDDKLHHFAKITEIKKDDVVGDSFEFEPKLGKEIPIDSKFLIFKGPPKNSLVVAIGLGHKIDTASMNLRDYLVCSRPLFYFYNSKLDKKNELNHNTKYYAMQNAGATTTVVLQNHTNSTKSGITFRTKQAFGNKIIDYSKFSLSINITDKLREIDVPTGGSSTVNTNEGNSITVNNQNYNSSFPNARRDINDNSSSFDFRGPTRYLHYSFSPMKANLAYGVFRHNHTDAIGQKGGYSETTLVDNARIQNKKIKEFEEYRVRHLVHRGNMFDFFSLPVTYSSTNGTNDFTFNVDYDLNSVLTAGDEVQIDNNTLIITQIHNITGTTQRITFNAKIKQPNSNSYATASLTPTTNAVLRRRTFNPNNNTLMVDFPIISGRTSNIFVSFTTDNLNELFATVISSDSNKKILTLSFDGVSYEGNIIKYALGEFNLFVEKFNGEIEQIEIKKEQSQTIVEVKGRNKINKLLSPIVNLNSLFSEDIIYSTQSPYNKVGSLKAGQTMTISLGDTFINTGLVDPNADGINFDNYPTIGTKLFGSEGYIGEVTGLEMHIVGGQPLGRRFNITPSLCNVNGEVYMETEKNYILSKALGSSSLTVDKPTSLVGASEKNLILTAGQTIDSSGNETGSLISSSSHPHPQAIGYAINSPSSILSTNVKTDTRFQTLLKDEFSASETFSSFDTVNSLIDFEVVSTEKKDNKTVLELVPYIPITLGRKQVYVDDTTDIQYTSIGNSLQTMSGNHDYYFKIEDSSNRPVIGDYIYKSLGGNTAKEFVGIVQDIVNVHLFGSGSNQLWVQLDRSNSFLSTHEFFKATIERHNVNLINSAHLWGGKFITIPDHKINSTQGVLPLNIANISGTSKDNWSRYGANLYKPLSIQSGQFGDDKVIFTDSFISTFTVKNPFADRQSFCKFNASCYSLKPNISSVNVNPELRTDSNFRLLGYDSRGRTSVFGSNTQWGLRIHRDKLECFREPNTILDAFFRIKTEFEGIDSAAERLFMYITSDLLPYSDLRTDSIFHTSGGQATKNIQNYNLFLLSNKQISDSSTAKGSNIKLKDDNFQTLSFTTDQDITSLKKAGLMRLTELVVDEHFNLINPELDPKDSQSPSGSYQSMGWRRIEVLQSDVGSNVSITNMVVNSSDSSKVDITFDGFIPLFGSQGEITLYDSNFNVIAFANASDYNTSPTSTTITFDSPVYNAGGATSFSAPIYIWNSQNVHIASTRGRRKADSFFVDSGYHPLKGAIVPANPMNHNTPTDTHNWGGFSNSVWTANDAVGGSYLLTGTEIVLPTALSYSSTYGSFITLLTDPAANPNRLLNHCEHRVRRDWAKSLVKDNANPYINTITVVLDTYSIEDADNSVEAGHTSCVLGHAPDMGIITSQMGSFRHNPSSNKFEDAEYIALRPSTYYKQFKNPTKFNSTPLNQDHASKGETNQPAGGAYLGFKLVLSLAGTSHDSVKTTGGTAELYSINTNNIGSIDNQFLKFVDLTGCYLVPETSALAQTSNTGNFGNQIGRQETPLYVYSHEISETDEHTHKLLINNPTGATLGRCRILQPNPVCMYDFFPTNISLNTLDNRYTKMASKNEVYSPHENGYFYEKGNKIYETEGEAVLSMFTFVDINNASGENNFIVSKDSLESVFPLGKNSVCLTDGKDKIKTEVNFARLKDDQFVMNLNEVKRLDGIPTISETFTVSSLTELKIDPDRACIGTTTTTCFEAEDLINELLETEGVEFTTEKTDYPLAIAPNFQGIDLFTAINSIADSKRLKLVEQDSIFKLVKEENSDFYNNVIINDSEDYQIYDFKKKSTIFDFYNEVIVYGNTHKATRKDIRSIKEKGRKTLEVVKDSLLTQEETNSEAQKLLRLHTQLNQTIQITMNFKGLEQLMAGDIIHVELERENISLSEYIVLEITHELNGLMTLELGRYSKNLSDIFADLLNESRDTKASLRNEEFLEKINSFDFLEEINIKELKLLVRKRGSSGGQLGFGTPLNTGTTPLGLAGEITITDLIEEDLI